MTTNARAEMWSEQHAYSRSYTNGELLQKGMYLARSVSSFVWWYAALFLTTLIVPVYTFEYMSIVIVIGLISILRASSMAIRTLPALSGARDEITLNGKSLFELLPADGYAAIQMPIAESPEQSNVRLTNAIHVMMSLCMFRRNMVQTIMPDQKELPYV